jgi:hypothetical protein
MSKNFSQFFDRPVFIIAAPRSGSTLLFETLIQAKGLHSIGDESHGLIERFPSLRPESRKPPSNFLDTNDLNLKLREDISQAFFEALVDCDGQRIASHYDDDKGLTKPLRFIEKTPKNILRIPFFEALYPDALYIYLYRDPLENISSIIDGWRSGNFVTYPGLQLAAGRWSFLLPPDWEDKKDGKLESIACWQWCTSHLHAIKALSTVNPNRVHCLNYSDFLLDSAEVIRRLCTFIDIDYDENLSAHCEKPLPLSKYTLGQPQPDKWKKNAMELASVMQGTRAVIAKINEFVGSQSSPLKDDWTSASLRKIADANPKAKKQSDPDKVSRNQPCPCGSGKKYKRCHGAIA